MPCWDCNTMGNKICGPVGTVDCENLKLGDAYMGIMPHCYMVEASKLYPSPANFSAAYLGSDQSKAPCANYTIPSKMYPGVTHYFTDGTPVAGCTS